MGRIPRMVRTDPHQKTIYHIISRTALAGLPFEAEHKDELLKIIKFYSRAYAVDVLGFAIMSNHFHLLVAMHPADTLSDDEVRKRVQHLYKNREDVFDFELDDFRRRFSSLSDYVKDIKQTFSRYFNRYHERKGTLWSERFKSVIVEEGGVAMHCLAYVDLNPVRAGIVKRPEQYRWSSIGYRVQRGTEDGFLSGSYGADSEDADAAERFRVYRKYLYEVGRIEKRGAARIEAGIYNDAAACDFNISAMDRFGVRNRYFVDSGVIGSRVFVSTIFDEFRERCRWRAIRKPKRVTGVDGMYSLKRLSGI